MSAPLNDQALEGIAIVGMAGRFPDAPTVRDFWANLIAGRESISFFSDGQRRASDPASGSDSLYVAARGVLERPEWFDAAFFGMTALEAEVTDPQQRVFLEVAWEALEDAGYDPSRFTGAIGVFAGVGANTYYPHYIQPREDLRQAAGAMLELIGRDKDFIATRAAYKFNLRGPALNINTACSTSLVVVCQAVQSLLTFQCDMALAGGVSIVFPQETGYIYDEDGIMSPDGHTRAFDAAAQGTVFSSGAGAVALKRLADALEDGDEIYAVIRGAALNNDGASKASYTAPSATGQAEVIALAQALAGVDPRSISYVEAHGTATPIGDPIEMTGLTEAFRAGTSDKQFCAIGSLKTNVGHLDIAAGVAGLIKTALMLKHRQIPASLFYERPNPSIDFANSPFYVNTKLQDWAGPSPRRAGVSSFGIGGTNAHVVLEEAPVAPKTVPGHAWQALPLSAATPSALSALQERMAEFLRTAGDAELGDVAFTLQEGRKELPRRAVVVASSTAAAAEMLSAKPSPRLISSNDRAKERSVVFMFPGGGAQYPGAARQLYEGIGTFRERVDASCERLEPSIAKSVRHLIQLTPDAVTDADKAMAERPSIGLPMLFIVEHALAECWLRFGVKSAALIGHSVGEYVAATLAGVFAVDDALRLVQLRGQLFDGMPAGAMLSVAAPVAALTPFLDGLDIAVVNGPSSCVLSGPTERIDAARERLGSAGFEAVRLHIAVAAHSSMVEPLLGDFRNLLKRTPLRPPTARLVSNVTGDWLTETDATDPEYWVRHLRQTVRFSDGLERLFALTQPLLLEVGPGRVLSSLARQHPARPENVITVESMRHLVDVRDDRDALLSAAGRLWVSGVPVNWGCWHEGGSRRRVPLPTYPFERQRFHPASEGDAILAPRVPGVSNVASASPAQVTAALETAARSTIDLLSSHPTVVNVDMPTPPNRSARILDELIGIMQRLSGVDRSALDPDVTFLELGFESLLLGQVSLSINKTFGVRVRFRHFFEETPTLRQLAGYLDQHTAADKFAAPVEAPPPARTVGATPTVTPTVAAGPSTTGTGSSFLEAVINQQLEVMRQQLAALGASAVPHAAPASLPATVPVASPQVTPPPSAKDRPSTLKLFGGVSRGEQDGRWEPIPKGAGGGLTPRQQAHLDALAERYTSRTKGSKTQAEKARVRLVDPRGVAGFGPIWKELVYQIASNGSSGSKLWDLDGNEYVDVTMGFGSALFGHAPSFMTEAMNAQLKRGYEVGLHSPLAAEVASLFCEMTGSDRVCFCTSGTDAVIGALRAARAVTGKDRIATFIGDIHGRSDEVLGRPAISASGRGSMPLAAGIPEHIVGPVLTLEYGQPESLEIIREHAHELAAVLVEPVRTRQPDLQPVEFLRELRRITQESGIALVMDEVVTGFRVSLGGAQEHFRISGDLATWGKAAAGGMPIGMISGRAEYMNVLDGGFWRYGDASGPETPMTNFGGSGTFGKHPLTLVATLACLKHLKESGPKLQADLNARTSAFVQQLNTSFKRERLPIHVEHFSSFFLPRVLGDRRFEALLFHHLRSNGVHIYLDYPCFLSTAHSDADIAFVTDAFLRSARALRDGDCLSAPGVDATSPEPRDARPARAGDALAAAGQSAKAEPVGVADQVPASPGQVEIWLAASRGDEANIAFNQVIEVRLDGALDVEALRSSVQQLADRHDALRGSFSPDGRYFRIAPTLEMPLPIEDLAALDEAARDERLAAALDLEVATPFSLAEGPLARARLVRLASERHVLIFSAHHLVCDGWSLGMVAKDLGIMYGAATGQGPLAFDAHMQYREFLEQRDPDEAREAEEYWLNVYKDGVPVLQLPTDHPRPKIKTYASRPHRIVLDRATLDGLRQAAASQRCTLFNFLVSAYGILMHRLTGQDDVVIGVAAAGQASTGCDDLVGHCVSMLPTRSRLRGGASIGEYVATTKLSMVDAYDHQQLTFGSLLSRLRVGREAGRVPLVSTFLTHETETKGIGFGRLNCHIEQVARHSAIFDAELYAIEDEHQLALSLWLNTDLFDEETAPRWLGYYREVLTALARPQETVSRVSLLDATERDLVLRQWNDTAARRETGVTVHQLFARQVAARPRSVAVECNEERLTYAELDSKAAAVAEELVRHGVGPDVIVGLMVERSIDMVVALLGIFKSGGAYLPLDPSYPLTRLETMLEDSAAPVVLTHRGLERRIPLRNATVVRMEGVAKARGTATQDRAQAQNLAYVIYTSGSTGRPKGVELTHQGLVNVLLSIANEPGFGENDSLLAVTTLSFDVAASELLLPLITGGRVIIASQEAVRDGRRLRALVERHQPTFMHPTPVTWRMLIDAGWEGSPTLTIASTGEPLPRDLANLLLDKGKAVWNLYGPTETTIWSTGHLVGSGVGSVPIGRPVANTQLYILDTEGQPVPIGVIGELHVGGLGVGKGYRNRPDLTEERFIPDTFAAIPGSRLYRTGDLARYRSDGTVECFARIDNQVKLRGFRIELGEIEAALNAVPGVAESVVALSENAADGSKRLIGYVTPLDAPTATLRDSLRAILPDYMVPAAIVPLETLPRTPNGKIDRRSLPAPPQEERELRPGDRPADPLEERIAGFFREILGGGDIGRHDNFFDAGGDSLQAMRVLGRIQDVEGVDVSVQEFFTSPTVAGLAEATRTGIGRPALSAPITRVRRSRSTLA